MRNKRGELAAAWWTDGSLLEELKGFLFFFFIFKPVKNFLGSEGKGKVTFIPLGPAHASMCKL